MPVTATLQSPRRRRRQEGSGQVTALVSRGSLPPCFACAHSFLTCRPKMRATSTKPNRPGHESAIVLAGIVGGACRGSRALDPGAEEEVQVDANVPAIVKKRCLLHEVQAADGAADRAALGMIATNMRAARVRERLPMFAGRKVLMDTPTAYAATMGASVASPGYAALRMPWSASPASTVWPVWKTSTGDDVDRPGTCLDLIPEVRRATRGGRRRRAESSTASTNAVPSSQAAHLDDSAAVGEVEAEGTGRLARRNHAGVARRRHSSLAVKISMSLLPEGPRQLRPRSETRYKVAGPIPSG